jgi:selT/selW/selH-like putative selenoprotein
VSLAESIERETGARPELVRGDGGVFDVEVDGTRVFAKKEVGRFPEPEEILAHLRG